MLEVGFIAFNCSCCFMKLLLRFRSSESFIIIGLFISKLYRKIQYYQSSNIITNYTFENKHLITYNLAHLRFLSCHHRHRIVTLVWQHSSAVIIYCVQLPNQGWWGVWWDGIRYGGRKMEVMRLVNLFLFLLKVIIFYLVAACLFTFGTFSSIVGSFKFMFWVAPLFDSEFDSRLGLTYFHLLFHNHAFHRLH